MRGYESEAATAAAARTVLRIPMRGYESSKIGTVISPKIVTNPHAGL